MKKSFLALASFAAIAVGCQVESVADLSVEESSVVYEAVTEAYTPATKTAMDGLDVVWSEGDQIGVFVGYTAPDPYVLTSGNGTADAKFAFVEEPVYRGNEFEFAGNGAYYPYSDELSFNDQYDGVLYFSTVLPNIQKYTEGTFENGSFPMIAVNESADDYSFEFKNVLGVLKLQLVGTKTISSIAVSGSNGEILAGHYMMWMEEGVPAGMTGDWPLDTSVILDCNDGVELDATDPTDFYISLIPTVFENGFTVTITDSENNVYVVKASVENEVGRSRILEMPVVDVDLLTPPVDLAVTPSLTDADITITVNDENAIGFYGVCALKENWSMYSSYFTTPDMFASLLAGDYGMMMQLPGTRYEGRELTIKLSEFGWSEEMLEEYEMYNYIMAGDVYSVIIVPIYEDKDEYSLSDAFVYEVGTLQPSYGGSIELPEYEVVDKYMSFDVVFEASDDLAAMMYSFYPSDAELPSSQNYLDEITRAAVFNQDGTSTLSHRPSYGVLPGETYKLCVVLIGKDGKSEMHVLDIVTNEIPYSNEPLEIVIDVAEYDDDDDVVYATLASWPEDAKIYYSIDNNDLDPAKPNVDYQEAELIAGVLTNSPSAIYKQATVVSGNIEVSLAVEPQTYAQSNYYVHFFAVTDAGKVSHIVTSNAVAIPVLPELE